MLTRLLRGNELRKTRFHDEKGNPVPPAGWLYAPAALVSAAAKVIVGRRPERPMISYRAARQLARLLRPESRVAEFGSGFSTLWFARRCAFLLSIEDNEAWYRTVQGLLIGGRFTHVRHELRPPARYADLSEFPNGHFDLVMIDGTDRAGCVAAAVPKLRAGGWIYLDNSDKDMTRPGGDLRRAEALLLDAVERCRGEVWYFTDFSPTNFFAEQGLLARL